MFRNGQVAAKSCHRSSRPQFLLFIAAVNQSTCGTCFCCGRDWKFLDPPPLLVEPRVVDLERLDLTAVFEHDVELADAGQPTGLWHHNEFKVISAIRRCLEEKLLLDPLDPEYITATDWNGHKTNFHVGDRVLVHEDEGTLWEAEVLGFTSDGTLNVADEKAEGFESPSICEVINK